MNETLLTCHGQECKVSKVDLPLNGEVTKHHWKFSGPQAMIITSGSTPSAISVLDCFLWILPLHYLESLVRLIYHHLESLNKIETTYGEYLLFFGVKVAMSRFKFSRSRDLWKTEIADDLSRLANFGRFMSLRRFEFSRRCTRFSYQPEPQTNLTSEVHHWMLCEYFNALLTISVH